MLTFHRKDGECLFLNCGDESKKVRVKLTPEKIALYVGRYKVLECEDEGSEFIEVFGETIVVGVSRKSVNSEQIKMWFNAPMYIEIYRDDYEG